MRKTDKKIENIIRKALTDVCELALKDVEGFKWLTHVVSSYKDVPASLLITCVFETEKSLSHCLKGDLKPYFQNLIKDNLMAVGIDVKNIKQQVYFDSEEACEQYHRGNWHERLKL